MTDDRTPPERTPPPDPADGEVLSAYLAGDLDETAATALEERLAGDADLARRLDATADVLMALRAVDEVALPADAGRRLRERLGTAPAAAGDAAGDTTADATVTSLESRRRVPWSAVGGVAAGLVAVALVGGGLLQGFGTGGDSGLESAESGQGGDEHTALESTEDSASSEADTEEFGGRDRAFDEDASAPAPSAALPAGGPVLLDEEVALSGTGDVQARYEGLPEVTGLLGEPVPGAADRAAASRSAVAEAPAFRSGTHPGDCLDQTVRADPVIPVRVESVVYEGRPAVAYVLVSAGEGASTLDRAEALIVDPAGCAPRLTFDLT